MSQSITEYNSKKRLVLSNGEAIRRMLIGNDWTSIRLGILVTSHAAASIVGTPRFAFGVCSDLKGYGNADGTGVNLIGARFGGSSATWTDNSGDSYITPGGGSNSIVPFKRVVSTFTSGTIFDGSNWGITSRSDFTKRTALFVEIVKGSPNYTLRNGGPINSTGATTDITDQNFLDMMEAAVLTDHNSIVSGYLAVAQTDRALAFSESDGDVDSFFLYWNRTSPVMSIDAVSYRKLA